MTACILGIENTFYSMWNVNCQMGWVDNFWEYSYLTIFDSPRKIKCVSVLYTWSILLFAFRFVWSTELFRSVVLKRCAMEFAELQHLREKITACDFGQLFGCSGASDSWSYTQSYELFLQPTIRTKTPWCILHHIPSTFERGTLVNFAFKAPFSQSHTAVSASLVYLSRARIDRQILACMPICHNDVQSSE